MKRIGFAILQGVIWFLLFICLEPIAWRLAQRLERD